MATYSGKKNKTTDTFINKMKINIYKVPTRNCFKLHGFDICCYFLWTACLLTYVVLSDFGVLSLELTFQLVDTGDETILACKNAQNVQI